jgi:hypothetical protein
LGGDLSFVLPGRRRPVLYIGSKVAIMDDAFTLIALDMLD